MLGELIRARLADRGMSMRDMAEAIGRSHPIVSMVIRGERAVPETQEQAWIDALGLCGDDVHRFRAYCQSARAQRKAASRNYVQSIEREISRLSDALADRDRIIDHLERRVAELEQRYSVDESGEP